MTLRKRIALIGIIVAAVVIPIAVYAVSPLFIRKAVWWFKYVNGWHSKKMVEDWHSAGQIVKSGILVEGRRSFLKVKKVSRSHSLPVFLLPLPQPEYQFLWSEMILCLSFPPLWFWNRTLLYEQQQVILELQLCWTACLRKFYVRWTRNLPMSSEEIDHQAVKDYLGIEAYREVYRAIKDIIDKFAKGH